MPTQFLKANHVAGLFQVARSTIYKWKNEGLPYVKVGKTIRFEEGEVLRWFSRHRRADQAIRQDGGTARRAQRLVEQIDRLRKAIKPLPFSVGELVREGRRR